MYVNITCLPGRCVNRSLLNCQLSQTVCLQVLSSLQFACISFSCIKLTACNIIVIYHSDNEGSNSYEMVTIYQTTQCYITEKKILIKENHFPAKIINEL